MGAGKELPFTAKDGLSFLLSCEVLGAGAEMGTG